MKNLIIILCYNNLYLSNIEFYKLKYFNNWKNKYQLRLIISVSIPNYYYRNYKKK